MVGPAPVTDNTAAGPAPSLPGIPQLPTTTSAVTKPSSAPADDYYTPPTSKAPVAGKPAASSTSATAEAVPTSKCNCKIVTATTLITITSTKSHAAPTVAPEIDDSEDGHDDEDSGDDSDDSDADAAHPTYGHGHPHGSRLRRS